MTKVFNPSDSNVAHNINGTIYEIKVGETIDVKDEDVTDLLHLLGFLMVVDSTSDSVGKIVVEESGVPVEKEISVDEAKAKFVDSKVFTCNKTIKKNVNGVTTTIPCNYETKSKRALLAHQKNDHAQTGVPADNSTRAEEDIEPEVKPRGRPRKTDVE